MASPYIGEIRLFAGNFAPAGWALCQGQLMAISENPTLFQLLGTAYGGDGQNTFGLPNLQSRFPIHQASGFVIGQLAGTENVTLTVNQIPNHSHVPQANTVASGSDPTNTVLAGSASASPAWFATGAPTLSMAANMLANSGGSQPHDNMSPFLVINFIISLFGVFPSQN